MINPLSFCVICVYWATLKALLITLSLDKTTPLGFPVVPEVREIKCVSQAYFCCCNHVNSSEKFVVYRFRFSLSFLENLISDKFISISETIKPISNSLKKEDNLSLSNLWSKITALARTSHTAKRERRVFNLE